MCVCVCVCVCVYIGVSNLSGIGRVMCLRKNNLDSNSKKRFSEHVSQYCTHLRLSAHLKSVTDTTQAFTTTNKSSVVHLLCFDASGRIYIYIYNHTYIHPCIYLYFVLSFMQCAQHLKIFLFK